MSDYCNDITAAVRQDAQHRELARLFTPTKEELAQEAKQARAWAFEHGDHQPDGTIRSKDMKGYTLLPVGATGTPQPAHGILRGVAQEKVDNDYRKLTPVQAAKMLLPEAVAPVRPATGFLEHEKREHQRLLADAVEKMERSLAQQQQAAQAVAQQQQLRGILATQPGVFVNSDCERVSVTVYLRLPAVEVLKLRSAVVDHRNRLDDMLRGLQYEASYSLQHHFDVESEPTE